MSQEHDFKKYLAEEIPASPYAKKEEEVLSYWQDNDIFKKTLNKPFDKAQGKKDFIFFEGPPTANGRPGVHHVITRAFKDAMLRYKTMCGFYVRRKSGWDTHGLPVELEVEKQLGLKSKKEIEQYGIAAFNEKCKESVWKYVSEWQNFTRRVGYWVDLDDPYVTYNGSYVESLWWVFKQIADKGLLYKDYRIVPWCSRCGTGLSSHELAQGYADVKDISITAKFELDEGQEIPITIGFDTEEKNDGGTMVRQEWKFHKTTKEKPTYILAWTTTPWTLPGNVALAVGRGIQYALYENSSDYVIVAQMRARHILGEEYKLVGMIDKGVLGRDDSETKLSYKPLFPYFSELATKNNILGLDKAFKVYAADFVTTEDGTGVVHTAVMYGADDFTLGTQIGLPKMHLVDAEGKFVAGTGIFEGRFVKETIDNKPTLDIDVIKYLQENNTFFSKENYLHSYPHCWRCKTPLIYYARDSWYIDMQSVKQKLIEENKTINWEPEYVRDGRFGEWLRDVKDWAISRERYWGTPMPVWESDDGERMFVGGYEDIYKHTDNLLTKVVLLRHGESVKNIKNVMDASDDAFALTEKGIEEARSAATKLVGQSVDVIYSSPTRRARETAEIIAKELGLTFEIIEGLREVNSGVWEGMTHAERALRPDGQEYLAMEYDEYYNAKRGGTGESWKSHGERIKTTVSELIDKNAGKTILCVGHQPLIAYGEMLFRDLTPPETGKVFDGELAQRHAHPIVRYVNTETKREFDPHRPFVDDIVLTKDGKEFRRVKEVLDVWFDSGAMPFAQDHYMGEGEVRYPADFISEAMDQTRGWFYTLHAVGNLLGQGKAYKNVICLGLINDEKGHKMSKSVGNIVSPWYAVEKFGADTVRFWMYSVSGPGDAKSFDEKTILETQRKVFGLLDNVVNFYEMYKSDAAVDPHESTNVLDQWILALLSQLIKTSTEHMDKYQLLEPTRAIRDFVADLSQWYIRRSRDRFKGEDENDRMFALATTQHVLVTLAKLLAPFTPFFAEDIYNRSGGELESVHLEDWPELEPLYQDLIEVMQQTRTVISDALDLRTKANIKVRQPLAKLVIPETLGEEYIKLIQDEVNVKEVVWGTELSLDTNLTDDLIAEGNARELIRAIQDMRKSAGLMPEDRITLGIQTDEEGKVLVEKFKDDLRSVAGVTEIVFEDTDGQTITAGGMSFKVVIK